MITTVRHRPFRILYFAGLVVILSLISVFFTARQGASLRGQTLSPDASFPDVGIDTPYGGAAAFLRLRDIVSGFPDGNFKPQEPVNRAQAAKMLLLGSRRPITRDIPPHFAFDVPTKAWFAPYIVSSKQQGIMNGYDNGTFRPEQNIVRSEFFKMLSIAFHLQAKQKSNYTDVERASWYAYYADTAETYGALLPDGSQTFQGDRVVTRGEAAFAIARIIQLDQAIQSGNDAGLTELYERHLINQQTLKALQAKAEALRKWLAENPVATPPPEPEPTPIDPVVSTETIDTTSSEAAPQTLCTLPVGPVQIEGGTQFGLTTCFDVEAKDRPVDWSWCLDARDPSLSEQSYCACTDPLVIGAANITWRSPFLQKKCAITECPANLQNAEPHCDGQSTTVAPNICARNAAGVCQWYSTCVPRRCCDHICATAEQSSCDAEGKNCRASQDDCGCCNQTTSGYKGECAP